MIAQLIHTLKEFVKSLKTLTKSSTKSKPSTESVIAIKKNKSAHKKRHSKKLGFFFAKKKESQIDTLLDLYWGGPERRITGLTIKIIGVNAFALLTLVLGILYLSQYQDGLIGAKLETFKAEVALVSAALAEGAVEEFEKQTYLPFEAQETVIQLNDAQARRMVKRLSQTMKKRIRLFDEKGIIIADSHQLVGPGGIVQIVELEDPKTPIYSVEILKKMALFIIGLVPRRQILPVYPDIESQLASKYPDADVAMKGQVSISAWNKEEGGIFLSAASPLQRDNSIVGAVLLTREGQDIEEALGLVWVEVLKIFMASLFITVLLSIYLSGLIARPLRKLARAADAVRVGQSKKAEIPDLSYRNDEIGELSVVLRDMTHALWDRMDLIESFAADVAHELKNPLTSLRSAVETASNVKKQKDREKLLGIIRHDVDRLDRLISDISAASRLDAELTRETLSKVNMGDLLSQLIDFYKNPLEREEQENKTSAETENSKIELEVIDEEEIYVWGVSDRLGQVFSNLISNALSFAPKGSLISIFVVPDKASESVKIIIEDEGPGVPEGKKRAIFERFYSQRPEHEDYGSHSGLGLSICKQIIEAHKGEIYAENIKNSANKIKGARFVVILNLA